MDTRIKSGGRTIGTPNKLTKLHREFVQSLLDCQTAKIETELNSLSGKEYLSVILSLMDFAIPKLTRSTDIHHFNSGCDEIIIKGEKYASKIIIE